ncbi:MAG: DoxX family membrane protein [Planctomycetes bacterium]|nr:DoxX family membrane protein [Planctomycetota bacterium]
MSLSQNASLHLAPLISRILLSVIVLPAGYVSIFRSSNFTADEAARVDSMGSPAKMIENSVEKIKPAAWRVEIPAAEESAQGADGEHAMRNLNRLALRLDDSKVPQPLIVAWVCVIAELVGGFMLLLGLLTRWFALLLFVGGIFRLGLLTWPQVHDALPWEWTVGQMHLFSAALAAVLLAFSLVLTGPGKFSLDRAFFARNGAD